jgi:hypothetical protein
MVTRRAVLWTAGAAAGALAAGCERERRTPVAAPPRGDLLVADTTAGLAVLTADGATVVPAGPGLLVPGAARLVRSVPRPGGTELAGHDVRGARVSWRASVTGTLRPCAISADGRLVALASGEAGGSTYRPAGRARTTLVVADDGGERIRLDLPGNLEPEAFSADGQRLFVLDYLPPTAPDRYRVRMLDLATGRLEPLVTRVKSPVPAGAEEEMRGQGRQAVYDERRGLLFTLYTHQPEHLHTRDLLAGARPGAAHVHAFVHTLSLREHWAYCIDLPAPFGERPAARHAIALDVAGGLAVVDAATGALAMIDPDALAVVSTSRFVPPAEGSGEAAARFTVDRNLVLASGPEIVRLAAGREVGRWTCASNVRGLLPHPDGRRLYLGQDGAMACHDVRTGRQLSRAPARGLVALRELVAARSA